MRRLVGGLLAMMLLAVGIIQAQVANYEALTIGATAVPITAGTYSALPANRRSCRGRLEAGQVRYRYDGTNPTATEGALLEVGEHIIIEDNGAQVIENIRFIRTGAVSGVLRLHCVTTEFRR